ncbi:MAG: tetratricopeptide repeat protein, partial [Pseudomonadota bacterium]
KILDAIHNNTGIPMRTLEPIFEAIEEEFPEQDIEAKVKEAVQRLQALADQKIDVGNLGDDIRKLIESARIQLIDSPDIEEATAAFEEEFSKAEGQMLRAAALAKEKARMFAAVFRFDDAIRHFELAARYNPDDACPWFNIGDIRKSRGNLVAALAEYEKGKAIAERTGKERDLSVSHNRIGDVERARGNTEAALAAYQAELVIVKELAAQDPTNSEWQRDLSVSHERIGDVKASRGNDVAALAAFKDSLVIREKLAVQNPTNNEWQRDLSVSHNKIGDVERARGNVEAALAAYQVGLVIVEKLVGQDPINSEWQRDLSISYNKIGDVEASRGNGGAALAAYRSGFAIREKLVAQDPTNSGWQYDIFSSNWRIADLEPDPSKKIEYLTAGLERLEALHAENRLPPIHVRWIEKTKDWIDSIKGE